MQKTLRSAKASPFGRGVTVGDGEGKDVAKNKQTQRYEDFWLESSYRRQRGICPRACPLRRLRASSPKGRALGKTENIHSDTFPALTVVRYLKRGRVYQNSYLSGCAPADQFCAGSAVPAGGGAGQRPAVQRRAGSLRGGGGRGFLAGAAGPHSAVERRAALQRAAPGRWPWPRPMAGRGGGLFVRLLAWFWLLNLMLTGAVLLPGARMEVNNLSVYLPLSPEVLLVSAGCVYGGLTLALHLLGDGKKACFPAELEIAGVVLHVRAFHDTGFGVREPLSGCGVVLVRFAAVEARLPPALRTYLKETFSGSGILPPPELGGAARSLRYRGGALPAACRPGAGAALDGSGTAADTAWPVCRLLRYAAPAPGLDAAGGVGCDGGIMMLQRLKLLFDRLWAALACPGGYTMFRGAESSAAPDAGGGKAAPCPDDGGRRCRPG